MNVITNRNPIKTAYTKVLDSSTYEQPLYLILSFYTLINARLCTHVKTTYYNRKSQPFRWLFHMQRLLFLLPIAEMIFSISQSILSFQLECDQTNIPHRFSSFLYTLVKYTFQLNSVGLFHVFHIYFHQFLLH